MSKLFYGSICLTDLVEQAKQRHSAFSKAKNGKIYGSVNVWLNDEKDEFGNVMSIQLVPQKEKKDIEKKVYIGNCKESDGPKPISDKDASSIPDDFNVPASTSTASDISEPIEDLPF